MATMKIIIVCLTIFYTHTFIAAQNYLVFPASVVSLNNNLSFDSSLQLLKQNSLNIDKNSLQKAILLKKAGHQFQNLGKHEYARDAFQKALDINELVFGKESMEFNRALLDLSSAYMLLIRYYEAAGMYQEVQIAVLQLAGEQSLEYWHTLNENAIVFAKTRQWVKARNSCREALQLMDQYKHQDPLQRAVVYNNLGAVYKNQWQFSKAVDAYEMSMKLAKNIPSLQMSIAANLAEAYAWIGRTKEAQALLYKYEKTANQRISDKNLVNARIWTQYGCAYAVLKQFDSAKRCYVKAFLSNSSNITKIGSIPEFAQELMFGNDYLATCAQAGIMMYSIEMYKQIYESTQDFNALKEGYKVVQVMAKYGETLMDSYLSEDNKLILFKLGAAILFDRSIYFAHELYKHTQDQQYLEDAFSYAERSKSTLLIHALRSKGEQSLVMLPETEKAKEKALQQALLQLKKQKIESENAEESNALLKKINAINREIEDFKLNLMDQYPSYYKHRYDIGLGDLNAVQTYLAQEDAVLIEYALGVQMHYVFVISKDSLQLIPLNIDPTKDKLHTVNMRKVLTKYAYLIEQEEKADSLLIECSHYFYQTYLSSAVKNVNKGKHLIIIPDQHLAHLPFETFMSRRPNRDVAYKNYPFLLKDYSISYNYSATIMLNQKKKHKSYPVDKKGILAFAASYPSVSSSSATANRGSSRTLRVGLTPLPGAIQEVKMMQRSLPGTYFSGQSANEQNFKKNVQNYNIIHLAMHGLLDKKNPILSSLVFTDGPSSVEDNFLKAYEIAQMDIDADLVVLSACETGYGRFLQGEGVMSLAHSFSYAGASSVLMSLWQVNDYSTSKIMAHYYHNLRIGQSKDKALQAAKLDYLQDNIQGITQLPAFWAAFVQTGNTDPIQISLKKERSLLSRPLTWVPIGVIGFFLLLWYSKRKRIA